MSVRLISSADGFAFGFKCDGGCSRPEVVALLAPDGWETLETVEGERLCRCPGCRFDLLVEPLIRDLGWEAAGMRAAIWWSEADEAEANVIAWELNDLWRSDAPRKAKVEATEAAFEWLEHRHLLSEAKFLRALRARLEGDA